MSDLQKQAVEAGTTTIEVQDLGHTLKGGNSKLTLLISDVKLYKGQLIYVCGPNGMGKSTFLKLLALAFHPNRTGYVRILGETVLHSCPLTLKRIVVPGSRLRDSPTLVTQWSHDGTLRFRAIRRALNGQLRMVLGLGDRDESNVRRGTITYIPQHSLGLNKTETPLETIRNVLRNYDRLPPAEADDRATEALHKVELNRQKFDQPIWKLSGGQRAKVAVAKAYARKRAICLADEILGHLDPDGTELTLQIFQELVSEKGCTVAVIVQEPGALTPEKLRDRLLIRSFDRVIMMGTETSDESICKIIFDKSLREITPDNPNLLAEISRQKDRLIYSLQARYGYTRAASQQEIIRHLWEYEQAIQAASPKTQPNEVLPTPALQAESFTFYESGKDKLQKELRFYRIWFPKDITRFVNYEVTVRNRLYKKQDQTCQVVAQYYKPNGSLMARETPYDWVIKSDAEQTSLTGGRGWDEAGHWEPGDYRVQILIDGVKFAEGTFKIQKPRRRRRRG